MSNNNLPLLEESIAPRPRHIAIIMDGNGRWATARNLPRTDGHRAGAKQIQEVAQAAMDAGVEAITLYAFSTENWKRPADEVNALMNLLAEYCNHSVDELMQRGIRLCVSGRIDALPLLSRTALKRAIATTAKNNRLTVNFAINYGGRAEIVDAASALLKARMQSGNTAPISEEELQAALYNPQLPDPDLLIRTGGEQRISNFLLWELAYAELYFTNTYWPDFGREELYAAIREFASRHRRFGGV